MFFSDNTQRRLRNREASPLSRKLEAFTLDLTHLIQV
jgi:hypothetical protein